MYSPTRRDLLAGSALLFARRLGALPLADLKLGITTDEIDDDVLTAAKFLQQYNLHWAEIRNIWGPYNTAQPMEKIREAAKILDDHGIHGIFQGSAAARHA
jgi:hypothetical protein